MQLYTLSDFYLLWQLYSITDTLAGSVHVNVNYTPTNTMIYNPLLMIVQSVLSVPRSKDPLCDMSH